MHVEATGWGPLGRGGIDSRTRKIKEYGTDVVLFEDGGSVPTYTQPLGRGGLWIRRSREAYASLSVPVLLSRMKSICAHANRIGEQMTVFTKKHSVWAEKTERGYYVSRKKKETSGVLKGRYTIGFSHEDIEPTDAQLKAGQIHKRIDGRLAMLSQAWSTYSHLLHRALSADGQMQDPHLPEVGTASMVLVKDGSDPDGFFIVYQRGHGKTGGFAEAESPSWPWSKVRVVNTVGYEIE